MDKKAVGESLQTGKRSRFLVKKEIEALDTGSSNAHNTRPYKEIRLIR
jgi:hypothetical protein